MPTVWVLILTVRETWRETEGRVVGALRESKLLSLSDVKELFINQLLRRLAVAACLQSRGGKAMHQHHHHLAIASLVLNLHTFFVDFHTKNNMHTYAKKVLLFSPSIQATYKKQQCF